jgi:sulfite reductase beta subunit-like hemoprotein
MDDQWFIITDLDEFTDKARAIVYNNFGVWNNPDNIDVIIDDVVDNEKEEFDKILSHQESVIIVKELVKRQKNKKTQQIRYTLNDTIFAEIVHNLNDRMVSNIINGLVQKGLIETAFDDESNDFVFWVKDNQDENEKEKPETD